MNCAAPSLASLITGLVAGFFVGSFLAALILFEVMKRVRHPVLRAALEMIDDERVVEYGPEDNDGAPAEIYEVPADRWEKLETAVNAWADKHLTNEEKI